MERKELTEEEFNKLTEEEKDAYKWYYERAITNLLDGLTYTEAKTHLENALNWLGHDSIVTAPKTPS